MSQRQKVLAEICSYFGDEVPVSDEDLNDHNEAALDEQSLAKAVEDIANFFDDETNS